MERMNFFYISNKKIYIKIKMKDICKKISYGVVSNSVKFDGTNRYIRISDINEYGILKSTSFVSPSFYSDKFLVKKNDILITRLGNKTGNTYLHVNDTYNSYCAGYLIKATIKDDFYAPYIYYLTKTIRFRKYVLEIKKNKNKKSLNIKEYSNFFVYLPSLMEQKKAVEKLNLLQNNIYTQSKLL